MDIVQAEIPDQVELVERVRRSNRLAIGWHWFLIAAGIMLAILIDWRWVEANPLYSLVAILLVPSQYLPSIAMTLAKKKKRVEDLSESFTAGVFTKQKLLSLIRETARSLNLDLRRVPVYLTRDKSLNAYAVSSSFSGLLPSVRGVYLHRQALHVSTESGLRATIGHELGHLFPYVSRWHDGWFARLAFGGLLALFIIEKIGDPGAGGLMLATAAAWGFTFIDAIPSWRMSQPIEYLCDGFGAKASSVNASISDLLVFGNESQAQYELSIAALQLASQGRAINDVEAMKIYEDSLGYGPTDVESTMTRIREAVKKEKEAAGSLSIAGLVKFLWHDGVADSNVADARDTAIQEYETLCKLPLVDWKELTQWDPEIELNESQIEQLVETLVAHPDHLLFRLPTEPRSITGLTHPSFRNRILYLWKNQS